MKSNISSIYRNNYSNQISQGDILYNFPIYYYNYDDKSLDFLELPYCIIVSQDCDLTQHFNAYNKKKKLLSEGFNEEDSKVKSETNKIIPSVMLVEGFPAEQLRTGTHLSTLNLYTPQISKEKKTPWRNILQNETPRYHYLCGDDTMNISPIVFDFKRYYTVSTSYIYSKFSDYYLISLNELYRENLSSRFANYLSRIGLP